MDKERMIDKFGQQLEENDDIKAVESIVNEYKYWLNRQDYKQGCTPVPWVFKFVTFMFFSISLAITIKFDGIHNGGILCFLIFSIVLFFIGWLLIPLLNIFIRLNPHKQGYTAVVTDIVDSVMSNVNDIPNKALILKIENTDKQIIYETNGKKVKYDIGDRIDILVAFNTWIIK